MSQAVRNSPRIHNLVLKHFAAIAGVTTVIVFGAKAAFFSYQQNYLAGLGYPPEHYLNELLARQSHVMNMTLAIATVVELAFLGWMAVRIERRLAEMQAPSLRLAEPISNISRRRAA